jgi:dipeptidase E
MTTGKITRRIFAIGAGVRPGLIRHFVKLAGKERPKICLLPTASGDDPKLIRIWHGFGEKFGFEAYDQPMFISSFDQKKTFEEVLLSMDAIYVSGGNTINMLAVWQAQGVDVILREAYERGILLGGGSAGGICWFDNGLTDSRPIELTAMPAMGWLKGGFSPHFLSEPGRREYCHKYMRTGELSSGYALDEPVGILFENEVFVKAVGSTPQAEGFWVEQKGDEIVETPLAIEYLGG